MLGKDIANLVQVPASRERREQETSFIPLNPSLHHTSLPELTATIALWIEAVGIFSLRLLPLIHLI